MDGRDPEGADAESAANATKLLLSGGHARCGSGSNGTADGGGGDRCGHGADAERWRGRL
jgi:hypothetical protein